MSLSVLRAVTVGVSVIGRRAISSGGNFNQQLMKERERDALSTPIVPPSNVADLFLNQGVVSGIPDLSEDFKSWLLATPILNTQNRTRFIAFNGEMGADSSCIAMPRNTMYLELLADGSMTFPVHLDYFDVPDPERVARMRFEAITWFRTLRGFYDLERQTASSPAALVVRTISHLSLDGGVGFPSSFSLFRAHRDYVFSPLVFFRRGTGTVLGIHDCEDSPPRQIVGEQPILLNDSRVCHSVLAGQNQTPLGTGFVSRNFDGESLTWVSSSVTLSLICKARLYLERDREY